MGTIYFLIGEPAIGKNYFLNLITNEYFISYVHDRLYIIQDFIEEGPFMLENIITNTLRKYKCLSEETSFIVVMNVEPKFQYKSLRENGYKFKRLLLEDMNR